MLPSAIFFFFSVLSFSLLRFKRPEALAAATNRSLGSRTCGRHGPRVPILARFTFPPLISVEVVLETGFSVHRTGIGSRIGARRIENATESARETTPTRRGGGRSPS